MGECGSDNSIGKKGKKGKKLSDVQTIWEKRFWYLSCTRSLGVNKDESKSGLTVLRLKLNQGIKEAITLRKEVLFRFLRRILSFELCWRCRYSAS